MACQIRYGRDDYRSRAEGRGDEGGRLEGGGRSRKSEEGKTAEHGDRGKTGKMERARYKSTKSRHSRVQAQYNQSFEVVVENPGGSYCKATGRSGNCIGGYCRKGHTLRFGDFSALFQNLKVTITESSSPSSCSQNHVQFAAIPAARLPWVHVYPGYATGPGLRKVFQPAVTLFI
eukprot:2481709-Rhodomonas_salina.3